MKMKILLLTTVCFLITQFLLAQDQYAGETDAMEDEPTPPILKAIGWIMLGITVFAVYRDWNSDSKN